MTTPPPPACVDLSSQLRGLGVPMSKFGGIIQPTASPDCTPPVLLSSNPVVLPKPRACKDPHGAVSGRLVAGTAWAPAVVDDRDIRGIIGMPSRMDGRAERIVMR